MSSIVIKILVERMKNMLVFEYSHKEYDGIYGKKTVKKY